MKKIDRRITALAERLAGEKLPAVLQSAQTFEEAGKSPERALADALEKHKCLPKADVSYDA